MSELIIRPMTEADIPVLCLADGGETPENRECFERYLGWQEQDKDCVFLLAFSQGQLAGHLFVFYHDCPSGREGIDLPRLANLLVYPDFRNRGVAKKLMMEGERLAAAFCDRVFLTAVSNSAVEQTYERWGYRPFEAAGDEVVLIKQLK